MQTWVGSRNSKNKGGIVSKPKKTYPKVDEMRIRGNQVFSQVRKKWILLTPEERVRQEYLQILVKEYGFEIEQMAEEEEVTGRGSGHARADYVIWRSIQDKNDKKNPLIIVECKSDNITIKADDYFQGDNYSRLTGAPFFVTHNNRETKYWRVLHDRMPKSLEEIEGIPRNREKKDPAAAFDEIAKILFIKVDIERRLRERKSRKNLFTAEFLEEQSEIHDDPINMLFNQTKKDYKGDKIFDPDETVNLKFNTAREIVKYLERYNLSDTSEDIKGIAFERFLGRTFRGEIGQFFTPRSIVEFMVHMVNPKEGDIICDPASGSGGFLIRFFEIVREQILSDADREYKGFKTEIENKKSMPRSKKAEALAKKYQEVQDSLDITKPGSRLWNLANRCIYGTDANDRMARTSKMNMIMHGDGHGGVHYHDGFLNVNGIFEGRFNIILTNPPFGANVEPDDEILESDIYISEEDERRYISVYGEPYKEALERVRAAKDKPIASLFELPKSPKSKVKTEILFIERCLSLLKQGGSMGIVLPEGVFNNPSLAYVREFCEDCAFIWAVVSLPQETFYSSGASVKASLLFMKKFTEQEKTEFEDTRSKAIEEIDAKYADEIAAEEERLERQISKAKENKDAVSRKASQKELRTYQKEMKAKKATEARALLKERFSYPIFLYEAEKVGITATGDDDLNELYPNDNVPQGIEKTCVEVYREFVWFSDLSLWGVHGLHLSLTNISQWNTVSLGNVCDLRFEVISPEEINSKEVQLLDKVSFDEGKIFAGKRTKTKMIQYRAKPGDIVVSKINARKRAIGIVRPGLDIGITIHFRALIPALSKIDTEFLWGALRSSYCTNQFEIETGGIGKGEISEKRLLSIQVPLPPLETQEAIVERWQKSKNKIDEILTQAEAIRSEIDIAVLKKLGFQPPKPSVPEKVFTVSFKGLLRWSVSYNQSARNMTDLTKGRFPVDELGTLLDFVQYGTSEKANNDGSGIPIIRMNNVVDGELNFSDLKYIKLSDSEKGRLVLEDGDVLFNRTNSKELVGKCAVFHEESEYVFASYLIRLRTVSKKLLPDYLAILMNGHIGRQQIDTLSRQIIGQANINSQEICSFQIPLPPLSIQEEIVKLVAYKRAEIAKAREDAEKKTLNIEGEIEALILGTKKLEDLD
jgi:type I restriction enzyme M protein